MSEKTIEREKIENEIEGILNVIKNRTKDQCDNDLELYGDKKRKDIYCYIKEFQTYLIPMLNDPEKYWESYNKLVMNYGLGNSKTIYKHASTLSWSMIQCNDIKFLKIVEFAEKAVTLSKESQ